MCSRRLKHSLLLSVLFSLAVFLAMLSPCSAEVRLTDEEAQEMLNEISQSKVELIELRNTYNEQKTFYEEQLEEAQKETKRYKTTTVVSSTSSVILIVVVALLAL